MNNTIEFLDWGVIGYEKAFKQQEELFSANLKQKEQKLPTNNHLIFCEHPHVYTLGKSGDEQNMLIDLIQLQAKNAEFFHTNRGGDITYHGPEQLVGYPIFDLENFGLGLKQYIHLVEDCIIDVLKDYGIESGRLDGATGVWLDTDTKNARKICAIGVKSSRYITMHGFALNVNTQLEYFDYINPCGFKDKGVTSIQKELGEKVDMKEVKRIMLEKFAERFNSNIIQNSEIRIQK